VPTFAPGGSALGAFDLDLEDKVDGAIPRGAPDRMKPDVVHVHSRSPRAVWSSTLGERYVARSGDAVPHLWLAWLQAQLRAVLANFPALSLAAPVAAPPSIARIENSRR
jgi:hypothetical protein